jgi:cobalt-zinc-cadmium efflux system outer membrane protein
MPLEVGGQRKNRIAVSEAVAKTGEAELAATTLEIHVAVRRAYFARLVADARRSMLDDVRTLATRARDAATIRFDAGSAPRLEVLQAELALAQADNDATTAAAASTAARARLNALLGYPPDTDVTLSTPLDPTAIPAGADAVARARDANTSLAVLTRQIEEARARVALARALRAPDVVAEGAVTRGAEPEFSTGWRAAVSVTAPIFTRHTAAVTVEQATLSKVTAEREAALVQLETEVGAAVTVASARREAFLRYRDQILPQVVAIETMADDSYRLGQTGLAAYLLALQSTRDARLNALQAAADFQDAVAELEHAMGTPLP